MSSDEDDNESRPCGLTGLKNLGNTCYMNAALQSLSNCPPLTRFFLNCNHFVRPVKAPQLSKSYLKLIRDLWDFKRHDFVTPAQVSSGIKSVHSMFRGFQQHDTQEFLRCFMDVLHEELKEPVIVLNTSEQDTSPSSEPSESDYDTCDSATESERYFTEMNPEDNNPIRKKARYRRRRRSDPEEDRLLEDARPLRHRRLPERSLSEGEGTRHDEDPTEEADKNSEMTESRSKNRASTGTVNRKNRNKVYRSIISDVFDGKILSHVQCLYCETKSETAEVFQDLSLPIPPRESVQMLRTQQTSSEMVPLARTCGGEAYLKQGWVSWMFGWVRKWLWGPNITLIDCLSAFFSADELKGDNMYSCEKCKKLRNGIKYCKVLKLPEILCIHLKRFRHDYLYPTKIGAFVSFPLDGLDMKPFMHPDAKDEVTVYDLVATICHHGTASGGHYTCYALNEDNAQWYEFDDQQVSEVDNLVVQNCEAYVLFYRKQNEKAHENYLRMLELMNCPMESLMHFYVSKQWLNKVETFAEPGPITNNDFLCIHGGVQPKKEEIVKELVKPVPQNVWEFLFEKYGGGPVCNHLFICNTCKQEEELLKDRRLREKEQFVHLNDKFSQEDQPHCVFALSMRWYRQWEKFISGKEEDPPGPIDNSNISIMKNGVATLKSGSDYGQVSADSWRFFQETYGGGPEVILRHQFARVPEETRKNETVFEQTKL